MKTLLSIILCCLLTAATVFAGQDKAPLVLEAAGQQVTQKLEQLDDTLKKAAAELARTGLTGEVARKILADTCTTIGYAIDCSTVDPSGRMRTVEPARYRTFEGKDISAQPQVIKVKKTKKPVLSAVFRSVEGYDAVDAEYPVISPSGEFVGSVSVLFKPEKLLQETLAPLTAGLPVSVWVMEQGGRILYDPDRTQIGLNLFSSSRYRPYTSLIRLGREISGTQKGSGSYRFTDAASGKSVNKRAFWNTVALYDTPWRLVSVHPSMTPSGSNLTGKVETPAQGLMKLASTPGFQSALVSGSRKRIVAELRKLYESIPGIYSIQWVDPQSLNRFGYPAEHSLEQYDFHAGRAPSDREMIRIVEGRKPAVLDAPLFEEQDGGFSFQPVFRGKDYLGMIYTIVLKKEP